MVFPFSKPTAHKERQSISALAFDVTPTVALPLIAYDRVPTSQAALCFAYSTSQIIEFKTFVARNGATNPKNFEGLPTLDFQIRDCDQILPNLFVGGFPSLDEIDTLKANGITAVLNLQSDDDFGRYKVDWPAMKARYSTLGIEVRRVPIIDFDDDDLRDKLSGAVRVLAELLGRENTVFVHCNARMNRSPSVGLCYLHWIEGRSLNDAEQHVRKSHSCAPVMEVIRMATWDRRRGLG